ncbi:carboxymuconolactone decarboxylase family protein [Novosphingobium sp. 1949]|uniref:Carboxymuconolactone decarboxylase family protein n=1 Tax=Novosphingobium organovorum TaxID=2930092 RepID=A0ABT0BBX6_9SPHN|nr:carboxymuconolactone decarboxylase family protein [Novosphingobium organovorum]MCJ2182513.1 carboxymuconolactone decarboxylase family protein [Novosphingobium organovorum]
MGFKSDWNQDMKDMPGVVQNLVEGTTPDFNKAFRGLQQAVFVENTLTVATKELIAVALAVAARCDGCIVYHVKAAIAAGCTRDELGDALSVAVMMGGGPSHYYSGRAMDAFNQLTAA